MSENRRHTDAYLANFDKSDSRIASFSKTADVFCSTVLQDFDHRSRVAGLLFGEVQSGKTSQTFAILAATADYDEGFSNFIYLSTDNVALQEQTLARGISQLSDTFEIIGETDELRFLNAKAHKPCLIVLKKNSRVLDKWVKKLQQSGRIARGPVFIVDDEGDAASPNTKINRDDVSEIHARISDLKALGTSSILLQVTATPQALFMLAEDASLRPKFIHQFEPGPSYLGGEFFFSRVDTSHNVFIPDDLDTTLSGKIDYWESSLGKFLTSFAVIAAVFKQRGSLVCNALIHPSVSTTMHHTIARYARDFYRWLGENLSTSEVRALIKSASDDLKRTFPDASFVDHVVGGLSGFEWLRVSEMNSTHNSVKNPNFDRGFNVIVGGNTLGRGVTFPALQATYYSRSSKSPQADTYWQHSRMFGYDRDQTCLRVYMPAQTFALYAALQESNHELGNLVRSGELGALRVVLPRGVKPTRANVVDNAIYAVLVGGTNYFPSEPDQTNAQILDETFAPYSDGTLQKSNKKVIVQAIKHASSCEDWPKEQMLSMLESFEAQDLDFKLIVGRNRDVGRTGTLLTETDRRLGAAEGAESFVVTAYRLTGQREKGWAGEPFWMVNVRIPSGYVYHHVRRQ